MPEIQEEAKSKVMICANADCSEFEKETPANWCPKCGSYINPVEKTEQVSRQYFWFQEDLEIDDDTFNIVQGETSSYLFSNLTANNIDPIDEMEVRLPLVLNNDYGSSTKLEFARLYAEEIKKLESFYKRRFEVHFGIIKEYT